MRSIGGLIVKCAVLAAVLVGVVATSQFSERKTVAAWAPNAAPERAAKPVPSAPTQAAITEQRLAATDKSCAAQVWPNIAKDCISGRVEPERREARSATAPQPQPQIAAVAAPARSSAAADPATTGALPAAVTASAPAPSIEPAVQIAPRAPRQRETQRARKPAPSATATAVAQRAAPPGPERIREPIQFRQAEGRN
jgi:hypothetical protein